MPVNVKDYINSMNQISSKQTSTTNSTNLKTQALLSQLIEAISYANSIDFRKKTLNAQVQGTDKTGKEVLDNMKAQEALVKQLAEGQKLSAEQNRKLIDAIDKFYELSSNQEVDYKKFAASLEKYALQKNMPEAVKTRLINDSRDAHIIGTEDKAKQGLILPIIKKIKYLLEDSAESTKQFGKKFFVTLDEFKDGVLGAFGKFGEDLLKGLENGSFINQMIDVLKGLGMGFMFLQGLFKSGTFKEGQIAKWVSRMFMPGVQKGVTKVIGNAFGGILKGLGGLLGKLGLKSVGTNLKLIGRTGSKFLKKIPLIGTIISTWMGIERWKQKDYAGALIEFGSGIAAAFPGVGTIISVLLDLINLGKDIGPLNSIGNTTNGFISNIFDKLRGKSKPKDSYDKESGDAPVNWQNESGNYSPRGLTSNALTATNNFNRLIGGGLTVTSAFRDPVKMMPLWRSARPIPGSRNRINKYGNEMADPTRSNHARGLAIDVPKSLYNSLGKRRFTNLAKQAGFSLIYPEHSAVHLEVPKSGSQIAAVTPDNQGLGIGTSIEPFDEGITASEAAIAEAQPSMSFDEMMAQFNKFNQDIVAGANTQGDSSAMKTVNDYNANITQGANVSKAPVQQNVQYTSNNGDQQTMTKEIEDTDIALLNSILFS